MFFFFFFPFYFSVLWVSLFLCTEVVVFVASFLGCLGGSGGTALIVSIMALKVAVNCFPSQLCDVHLIFEYSMRCFTDPEHALSVFCSQLLKLHPVFRDYALQLVFDLLQYIYLSDVLYFYIVNCLVLLSRFFLNHQF